MNRFPVLALTASVAFALVACAGGDGSSPPPNTGPAPTMTTTAPPPPPTTTTTATATPPIPTFPPPTSGGSGGTAQALDPNVAAAATTALSAVAATEAPGMTKDGPAIAGNFQEGQTLEGAFTFQPGKCYTLVAAGAGITQLEVEMQYATPIPGLSPSIGKSTQTGAIASMGGKNNCLRPMSPLAAPAKFIVRATKGAGLAAAQLYSK